MTEVRRYAAFTRDPATGNPAGVVLDSAGLDAATMQAIAAEVGYSETAFAQQTAAQRYRVRYFSPLHEVPFCGHATVATAVALAERDGAGDLLFDTDAGKIAVATTPDQEAIRASLHSVPTCSRPAADHDLEEALAALGWSKTDLDPRYPPHVAFAGNDHLVLAAGTRDRLARLDYDFMRLAELMSARGWTTLQLIWHGEDGVFHSRNPFPVGGVVEDPATGAAAAALGGYLREIDAVAGTQTLMIVQGEDMGRRSELELTVSADDPRVTVTGTAVRIPE